LDLRNLSVCQAAEDIHNGEYTAHDLIEKTLENGSLLNESLNIFIHQAGVDALEQAKAIDLRIEKGEKLPLAGIPVAVKDDICYGVLPTTFGSGGFSDFYSPYTATAVERLMEAGAIVVGKTNLDNMSLGSSTTSSPKGATINPWDNSRAAGSAGAVAVITGAAMVALESDSGGALRQGASSCGVAGLRPTGGLVSRHGLNLHSSSFGQIGVTALTGKNIDAVIQVIAGYDQYDASTLISKDESILEVEPVAIENLKIGFPQSLIEGLEPEFKAICQETINLFKEQGFEISDISLKMLPEALRAYYVIAQAEASSNHARFDGIRFGSASEADNLEELYLKSRSNILGREGRQRSIYGTYLLNKGNFDLYYRQALKVWNLVRREFALALTGCDLLLMPVVKNLPPLLSEGKDLISSWEEDIFCAPVSLSGLPALSFPAGMIGELPAGLQLVGPPFSEKTLTTVSDIVVRNKQLFPHGKA